MPGPDEKDELLKTPPAPEQRTTPMGSSDPSATIELPAGLDFDGVRLAGVSARYELEAELGRGGMGIVYRARDKETNERVALKVLKPEIASEQALLDRFKNELKLARKITHKRVCRTYELLRFGDTVVIAMEYVEGESLRAVLERFGSMSTRKGIQITQQVCSALAEAHAQGIVHRDLKPENLMLDRAGNVKVMDFGIARSIETGSTTTGNVIGTPAYMAPEQAEGKPVDARTDIYSLGLILYEMFTGAAAFRADTPLALAMKQIRETPPAPREVEPTLPLHIEKAIVKCLEKNPAKRFQSVEELEAALTRDAEPVAPAVAGEEVLMPVHLAYWQRADWVLVAAGMLAVVLSAFLYDRVLPFGGVEARFSRDQSIKKAQDLAAKYAPDFKQAEFSSRYIGLFQLELFPFAVVGHGLGPSLEHFKDSAGSGWITQGRAAGRTVWVDFDREGRVITLEVEESKSEAQVPPETVSEALPLARQYAQELFDARVADLAPTPYVYNPAQRRWATEDGKQVRLAVGTPVEWTLADGKTIVRIQTSHGRLTRAAHEPTRTEAGWWYTQELAGQPQRWELTVLRGVMLAGAMCWLGLILFFARRLYRQKFRLAWVPSLLCTLAAAPLPLAAARSASTQNPVWWLAPLGGGAVSALFLYASFSVPEYYLGRVLPAHLKTFSDLLSQGLKAQPSGLSVVRGTLLGMSYLALHLALLLLLGRFRWAAASAMWHVVPFEKALGLDTALGPAFLVLVSFAAAMVATWLLVALPIALLRRVTTRTPVLLLAVGAFWLVGAVSLPGALTFPVLPLYLFAALQGVAFAWVFLRYDLLTCFQAMLTVTTWLLCFPVLSIFGRVEFWSYIWVMAPWLLLTLLGVVMWFRPELIAWRRRTAAVFE